MEYPRTLTDLTDRPYDQSATISQLVSAINFAASYEDANLEDARDDVMDYWYSIQSDTGDPEIAGEAIDRVTDILGDHGYSLSVAEDYPGLWILDN